MLGLAHHSGKVEIYRPVGCSHCDNRGYTGRIPILELMVVNEEMRRLTIEKPTADKVRELAVRSGMKTMREHAVEKILAGLPVSTRRVEKSSSRATEAAVVDQ